MVEPAERICRKGGICYERKVKISKYGWRRDKNILEKRKAMSKGTKEKGQNKNGIIRGQLVQKILISSSSYHEKWQ